MMKIINFINKSWGIYKNNNYLKFGFISIIFIFSIIITSGFVSNSLKNIIHTMIQPQLKSVLIHTKSIFHKHEEALNYITSEFEKINIDKLDELERDITCATLTREFLNNKKVRKLLRELYNFKVLSEMEYIYILTRINKQYYFVITDEMIEIRGFNIGKPLLVNNYKIFNKAFNKGIFYSGISENENGEHYTALWLIKKNYLLGTDYNLSQGLYLVIDNIKLYGTLLLIICVLGLWYIKLH